MNELRWHCSAQASVAYLIEFGFKIAALARHFGQLCLGPFQGLIVLCGLILAELKSLLELGDFVQ